MKVKQQPSSLVIFRATLFIKSIAILAVLLVALLLQDRHGQAAMVWPVVVVLLMLVFFGTSWFESRLGARFFPLALAAAIVFQTIELGLYQPAATLAGQPNNPLTHFQPVEPFLFLLVPVALAAWRYDVRGALLAAGGAALLVVGITLLTGHFSQVGLIPLVMQLLLLGIVAGVTALASAQVHRLDPIAGTAAVESLPDTVLGRTTRDNLVALVSDLDARVDALYDQFDDAPDDLRDELAQLKLSTTDVLALITTPRRQMPLCSHSLTQALHEYVDGFRQRTGVTVALQLRLEPDSLQPDQAATAYQIVEEALDDVASHACAQASVSLLSSDSHIALSVHGASPGALGTDGATLASEARLLSLHRRAESVGGILCVSQQPQHGTTVACVFPRTTHHA